MPKSPRAAMQQEEKGKEVGSATLVHYVAATRPPRLHGSIDAIDRLCVLWNARRAALGESEPQRTRAVLVDLLHELFGLPRRLCDLGNVRLDVRALFLQRREGRGGGRSCTEGASWGFQPMSRRKDMRQDAATPRRATASGSEPAVACARAGTVQWLGRGGTAEAVERVPLAGDRDRTPLRAAGAARLAGARPHLSRSSPHPEDDLLLGQLGLRVSEVLLDALAEFPEASQEVGRVFGVLRGLRGRRHGRV